MKSERTLEIESKMVLRVELDKSRAVMLRNISCPWHLHPYRMLRNQPLKHAIFFL